MSRRGSKGSLAAVLIAAVIVSVTPSWAQEPRPGEPVEGLVAVLTGPAQPLRPGEQFQVTLELRNVSGRAISLYRHVSPLLGMPGSVELRLRAADGTDITAMQPIDEHTLPSPSDYERLHPGERMVRDVHINSRLPEAIQVPQLSPGHYRVFLAVVFSDEGRQVGVQDAWAGTVLSNAVLLEIAAAGDQ